MPVLVLVSCLFCLCSFAWAMVWHFRRNAGRSPALALVAICAIGSASLHIYALAERPAPSIWIPVAMYGASAILFWWAIAETRAIRPAACFQKEAPAVLVTSGPYAILRHPFYAAYDLTWVAGAIATMWWPVAVSAGLMIAVYHAAARAEERALSSSALASQHRDYIRRTGFYVPFARSSSASVRQSRGAS